ncbi:MAG TPA: GNAT family N-acetyltransferase [Candidatus Dormibacteraeota bacterium]
MHRAPQRLEIRLAEDTDTSAEILEAAASIGAAEGRPSWSPGAFTGPQSLGMSRLRKDLETKSLHLVWVGDRPVATFSLLESDALYWPASADDALYLHRFAVRRNAAGAGRHAVEWAVKEARRRGREYIRLDCLAENPGIRRYYERFGFAAVDETVIDGVRFSLYEMRVTADASLR